MKIEEIEIGELIPYAGNARKHGKKQIEQIKRSVKEFGFNNPVLIDQDGGIIAGHGRVIALEELGWNLVPCIRLDHLTPTQRAAYILADNRLTETGGGWDEEILQAEIAKLSEEDFDMTLTGWEEDEIQKIIDSMDGDGSGDGDGEVKFSEHLDEANNYVVLVFRSDIDWQAALTHFELPSVYSRRSNGKPWSRGIGRVVDGAKYLSRLIEKGGSHG